MQKRAERYLDLLSRLGADHSLTAIAKKVPVTYNAICHWRNAIPGFRERETAIREKVASAPPPKPSEDDGPSKKLPTTAIEHFFESLAKTQDRLKACKTIGVRWRDVKSSIKADADWKQRYSEFEEERRILAEDQLFGEMLKDKGSVGAAKAYLQAYDNRYNSKVTHQVTGAVQFDVRAAAEQERQQWLATVSQSQLPAADVVDAEIEEPN